MKEFSDIFMERIARLSDLYNTDTTEVPFFKVCAQCGRVRNIELPYCLYCSNNKNDAIGFMMTEE